MRYIVYILSFMFCQSAFGQTKTATATWDANVEPDLAGYRLYIGTSSRNYDFKVYDIGLQTSVQISENFQYDKRYYFALTAYDTSGNESGFSAEQSLFWPIPDTTPPTVPKNFKVVINVTDGVVTVETIK